MQWFIAICVISIVIIGGGVVSITVKSKGNNPPPKVDEPEGIDLTIDNTSYYNGIANARTTWTHTDLTDEVFFDFLDVKPGDRGEAAISLHLAGEPAWLCADLTVTSDDDVSCNAPELMDDASCSEPNLNAFDGELGERTNLMLWADDGDSVWETGEILLTEGKASEVLNGAYALADSTGNIWKAMGGPVASAETPEFLGTAWCFGEMATQQIPQDGLGANQANGPDVRSGWLECDGSGETNATQTDHLMSNLSFRALAASTAPGFACDTCLTQMPLWAAEVVRTTQGKQKSGLNVLSVRSDPNASLGEAQETDADGTFYSLGFGGEITLKFAHPVADGVGPEIAAYESTHQPYPMEQALVSVSQDGVVFKPIGTAGNAGNGITELDINGAYSWIRYVRLHDTTSKVIHAHDADGYDLDAIKATNYNTCLQTL